MDRGDHPKTFLLKALSCQGSPSWLKVRGWVVGWVGGGGPCDYTVISWDRVYFLFPISISPFPIPHPPSPIPSPRYPGPSPQSPVPCPSPLTIFATKYWIKLHSIIFIKKGKWFNAIRFSIRSCVRHLAFTWPGQVPIPKLPESLKSINVCTSNYEALKEPKLISPLEVTKC